MKPNTITFNAANDWVMRITADRRIEVNENVAVDEAAQKVLQAIQVTLDKAYGTQEPTACLIDGKLMAYGNQPLPQEGLLYLHMQKEWAGLMRGVRVEDDNVVISTKGNKAARELCGALIEEMNK